MTNTPSAKSNLPLALPYQIFLSGVVFCSIALSVAFVGSYKISGGLILASYLLFLLPSVRAGLKFQAAHKMFLLGGGIYLASILFEVALHHQSLREADPASKILLLTPFLLLLSRIDLSKHFLAFSFALGGIILLGVSLYDRFIFGLHRASGGINEIQFGNIACALGLICFFLLNTLKQSPYTRGLQTILVLGGLSALASSFLSGTRGGWVAIITVLLATYVIHFPKMNLKMRCATLLTPMLLITLLFAIPQTNVAKRSVELMEDIQLFVESGNTRTPTGERLDMWRTAAEVFINAPMVGVGKSHYLEYQKTQIDNHRVSEHLIGKNQAHNGYLDAAARRGIIGVAALCMFLFLPILVAWPYWRSDNSTIRGYAGALICLSFSFSCFNLTQSMFNHNSGIIMYLIFMVTLISALNSAIRNHA